MSRFAADYEALSAAELIDMIRSVGASVNAGMSLPDAWRNAGHLHMSAHDMVAGLPSEIRNLAHPIPFPGVAPLLKDLPQIATFLAEAERRRSRLDRLSRRPDGLLIGDVAVESHSRPLSIRWWVGRSHWGHQRQRAAQLLCQAVAFTQELGASPVEVLGTIARSMDEQIALEQQRRVVRAGPRASARLLSFLPLVGMWGAYMVGVNPVDFFASSLLGVGVAIVGVALMVAGSAVMRGMVRRATARHTPRFDGALAMDLAAAGLESGASIPHVMGALGRSMGVNSLCRAAEDLLRGVPWWDAWAQVPADFAPLAQVLADAWAGGALVVDALTEGAQGQRRLEHTQVAEEFSRLSVRLLLPLGLLSLPAFILLGVIPVIADIAGNAL